MRTCSFLKQRELRNLSNEQICSGIRRIGLSEQQQLSPVIVGILVWAWRAKPQPWEVFCTCTILYSVLLLLTDAYQISFQTPTPGITHKLYHVETKHSVPRRRDWLNKAMCLWLHPAHFLCMSLDISFTKIVKYLRWDLSDQIVVLHFVLCSDMKAWLTGRGEVSCHLRF